MTTNNKQSESSNELEVRNNNTGVAVNQGYSMFMKPNKDEIKIIGKPFAFKAVCNAEGVFKSSRTDEVIGKELQMELLNVNFREGTFFIYEKQQWLELLFIDKDNTVCTVLIKGQSIENFVACQQEIFKKNYAMGEVIVTAKMSERKSEAHGSKYHAVEFSFVPNTEKRIAEMQDFMEAHEVLKEYSLLDEMSNRTDEDNIQEHGNQFNQESKIKVE